MLLCRAFQRPWQQAAVGHLHDHPRSRGGTRQHAGKHTYRGSEVNGHTQGRDTGFGGQQVQHSAGNGPQRFARFIAQRGRALKPDKAEHGQHQGGAQRGDRCAFQPELIHVQLKPIAKHHHRQDDENQAHRDDFDPQHHFR